jgi:hypothetical protein
MIRISVDTGGTLAMLARAEKQAAYAASRALNTLAFQAMREGRALEIRRGRNHDEDRLLFAMSQKPDDSFATWATTCGWNGDKAKSKISRILERLKEDKLVTRSRKGWVLTGLGKDEARIDRNW